MIKNKCNGCTERFVGCHDSCVSYQNFAAECERIRQNKRNEKEYYSYFYNTLERCEKHKRQHGN